VASCRLLIKASAARELEALPRKERTRVVDRIRRLATNLRPPGSEKLSGEEKYRIRQGNYRILYSIDDGDASVLIVKIAHRRDVYR
jgi:mRNA interferase RelE/StbE